MTPLPLSNISILTRDELDAVRLQFNAETSNTDNQFSRNFGSRLPFYVAKALQTNPDYRTTLSQGMFRAIAYMTVNRRRSPSENIQGYVTRDILYIGGFAEGISSFVSFHPVTSTDTSDDSVYFLNAQQTDELYKYIKGDISISEFPIQELTEEEKNDPLIQSMLIPSNSAALRIMEHTSRFSGATWFEEIQKKTIVLAGVGGIGSWTCLLLARVQPTNIILYDDDEVEAANMSGQLYSIEDLGKKKVDALVNTVIHYANYSNVFGIPRRFTNECEASDIMICGFDNMAARKLFYAKWKQHVYQKEFEQKQHCLFIDGRLSAEYLEVYSLTGDDEQAMTRYENTLFSDEEADTTLCSYKQTSYMANLIGGFIVNSFTNFVANEVAGCPIRELPFKLTYDGNSMQHKIE